MAGFLAAALAACNSEEDRPSSLDAGQTGGTGGVRGTPPVFGTGGIREPFDLAPCEPTYESVSETVLKTTCAGDACHGPEAPAWNLFLTLPRTLPYLLSYPSAQCPEYRLVAPGDPEHSYLYLKVAREDPPCGTARMPFGIRRLPDHSIECIAGWIRSLGAEDAGAGD